MSRRSGLLLPGEDRSSKILLGRPLLACFLGWVWLVLRSSLLPPLHLDELPFEPLLPLVGAFAFSGRTWETWVVALALGWLSDSMSGMNSGRSMLEFALVAGIAIPLRGQVVLRDRWIPAIGLALCACAGSIAVALLLALLDADARSHWGSMPRDAMGTALAAATLWPLLRRVAGADHDRRYVFTGSLR